MYEIEEIKRFLENLLLQNRKCVYNTCVYLNRVIYFKYKFNIKKTTFYRFVFVKVIICFIFLFPQLATSNSGLFFLSDLYINTI